jgi:hypothetical protein
MTPWGYEYTKRLSVHTAGSASPKHMTHYTVAMAFIQAHGHFAALTKDGLLALSEVRSSPMGRGFGVSLAFCDGDEWFQEPKLFDVDEDGMVPSRDVREWLGY